MNKFWLNIVFALMIVGNFIFLNASAQGGRIDPTVSLEGPDAVKELSESNAKQAATENCNKIYDKFQTALGDAVKACQESQLGNCIQVMAKCNSDADEVTQTTDWSQLLDTTVAAAGVTLPPGVASFSQSCPFYNGADYDSKAEKQRVRKEAIGKEMEKLNKDMTEAKKRLDADIKKITTEMETVENNLNKSLKEIGKSNDDILQESAKEQQTIKDNFGEKQKQLTAIERSIPKLVAQYNAIRSINITKLSGYECQIKARERVDEARRGGKDAKETRNRPRLSNASANEYRKYEKESFDSCMQGARQSFMAQLGEALEEQAVANEERVRLMSTLAELTASLKAAQERQTQRISELNIQKNTEISTAQKTIANRKADIEERQKTYQAEMNGFQAQAQGLMRRETELSYEMLALGTAPPGGAKKNWRDAAATVQNVHVAYDSYRQTCCPGGHPSCEDSKSQFERAGVPSSRK